MSHFGAKTVPRVTKSGILIAKYAKANSDNEKLIKKARSSTLFLMNPQNKKVLLFELFFKNLFL